MSLESHSIVETSIDVAVHLGITTDLGKKCLEQALYNVKLLDNKNKDYGSENLKIWGAFGVLVRLGDKISRLNNLYKNQLNLTPNFESIEDSWADAANYSLIGQVLQTVTKN